MSEWTSERAILRDLSRAQGGGGGANGVLGRRRSRPAHISCSPRPHLRPLRAAERPPRLDLNEETEEEYFERCVVDGGGAPQRPDLGLIRHMLNMVREQNVLEDDLKVTDVAVISKLNPTTAEFIPTAKPPAESSVLVNNGKKRPKKVRQRNIALESILQALECGEQTEHNNVNDAPLTLLKPEDMIPNNPEVIPSSHTHMLEYNDVKTSQRSEDNANVDKVKTWLTTIKSPDIIKPVTVILESMNMFRKKSKPTAASPGATPSLVKDIRNRKPTTKQSDTTYKPSTTADDYYKKYLDKSQLMESLQDDIWTKAEKQMKQIDVKKRVAPAVKEELATEQEAGSGAEAGLGAQAGAEAGSGAEDGRLPVAVETELSTAGTDPGDNKKFNNDIKRMSPAARALSGWAAVRLPRARHTLPPEGAAVGGADEGAGGDDCPVCAALYRWRHPPSLLLAADLETSLSTPTHSSDDVTTPSPSLTPSNPHSTPEWIRKDAAGLFD